MKIKTISQTEAVRMVRRDFSSLNLKTRAIPDKTRYSRKQKHKRGDWE